MPSIDSASPVRPSRPRRIAAWIVTGASAAILAVSGIAKLARVPDVVANFEHARLASYLVPIGLLELLVVALLCLRRTASLGLLLVTGYLGGAVVTHLESGEPQRISVPLVLGLAAWVGYQLRFGRLLAAPEREPLLGHREQPV